MGISPATEKILGPNLALGNILDPLLELGAILGSSFVTGK